VILGSKRNNVKDKVPSHKSQTRDKPSRAAPAKPVQQTQSAKPPTTVAKATSKTNAAPKQGLPKNNVLRGLKAPRSEAAGSMIHSRLKKKSPWFQSILDPLHGADAKIPDETGVETGTCQLVERVSFTTNSNGFGGMRIFSPYANTYVPSGSDPQGVNWQNQIGASGTDVTWGTLDGGSGYTLRGWAFQGIEDLKAITNQHRIVSAEIIVESEISLSENKGEMCLFTVPFANLDSPQYDDYLNHYKSIVVPLNLNKPAITRWYPESREDWSFKSFLRTDGTTPSDQEDAATAFPYWQMGVLISGADPDAPVRVQIVVNYEFIPKFNTLNVVDAAPSPQDATEVDLVETWTQDLPVATVIPATRATSSPSTVSPQHGENDSGTGFGMFFNVIKELAPLALSLL